MAHIFFSYSHADEELRNKLEKHLAGLLRQGVIRRHRKVCAQDYGNGTT